MLLVSFLHVHQLFEHIDSDIRVLSIFPLSNANGCTFLWYAHVSYDKDISVSNLAWLGHF